MALLQSIKRDIRACYEHDPAAVSTIEILLAYPGFHARQFHRLAHFLHRHRVPILPRLVSHIGRFFTGIEIHPGANIGEGLFIDHGMGVVIGETSVIGDDCVIYQGVTLGGTSLQKKKRHPTLGNKVVVGSGSKLIGAITIGDNVKIGSGSVVTISVPSNATVVGVPGRVVAMRNPDTDTIEKLPDPEGECIERLEHKVAELEEKVAALEAIMQDGKRSAAEVKGTVNPIKVHLPSSPAEQPSENPIA
ncbi:MAG: serine O-acetyltransferase [Chloroflexota bacterium]